MTAFVCVAMAGWAVGFALGRIHEMRAQAIRVAERDAHEKRMQAWREAGRPKRMP